MLTGIRNRRLRISVLLMSGAMIMGLKNLALQLFDLTPFFQGFLDGMAVALALLGVIVLVAHLWVNKRF